MIAPLAFQVNDILGLQLIQIVQTTPKDLRVGMLAKSNANVDRVWEAVYDTIIRSLAEHTLQNVTVERANEPPEQSSGGKYRAIIPLS